MIKNIFILFLMMPLGINAQNWLTDYNNAKKTAKDQNKSIILVFQGSDWCAPCVKLDKEIWSTEEFINYASDHFVMLKADFPKRKRNALSKAQQIHNNQLAEQFNQKGYFPYVVVLDFEGTFLGSTGYKKTTPADYIKLLKSFIN